MILGSGLIKTRPASDSISTHSTLAAKIIAHWKLNETSGTRSDSKGSNHLADNNTVGYAAGKMDNAADFIAANSEYLSIADNADVSFGDEDFAITFWWNPDNVALNRNIYSKGTFDEYDCLQRSDGKVRWRVENSSGTTDFVDSTETLSAGTWYFVYCYHDAAANEIGISIDDGTPATAAHTGGARDSTGAFVLGANATPDNYIDGQIDSFSLWNDVLTAGEVTDLYNSGDGLDY